MDRRHGAHPVLMRSIFIHGLQANASMNVYVADISGQVADVPGLQMMDTAGALTRATRARYPNIPGGIETSCGYGCMIGGKSGKWTPPNFNRFGPVDYYTDNQTKTQVMKKKKE